MNILNTPEAMQALAKHWQQAGEQIALVPTMGALHEGHLALVKAARAQATKVVVSIFVNPLQFGPQEDFSNYPRPLDADLQALKNLGGVDAVFVPSATTLYPAPFSTYIVPEDLVNTLCGARRPGHFRGVCTVVFLLWQLTHCHLAVFGQKDWQQLQIIKRMQQNLWLPVKILEVPIVREASGLAKSSRNAYLSQEEQSEASIIYRALHAGAALVQETAEQQTTALVFQSKHVLKVMTDILYTAPNLKLDYLKIINADTLEDLETLTLPPPPGLRIRAVIATYIHKTRLIDNLQLI